ncbi:MAG TPA: hypothetical protein VFO78_05395 [Candidatus Limnocylindrales bacterium]|nr:hypothetical protein [Candidatus Limnocylindrales bacterium]
MSQLTLHVVGHAQKRGLLPRLPAADRLLADIELWLRSEYPDAVRTTRTRTAPTGERVLFVSCHPAAGELAIAATDAGGVEVWTALGPVGPGYQTFVARLVQRIGTEHEILWSTEEPEDGPTRTDLAAATDRANAERAYLAWLGTALVGARDARRRGSGGIHIGTPPGVRFDFDGAIATSLGPRDDEWLEKAIGDPRIAIDVAPWWADAIDARSLLNRALCLMWTQVRWRPPADSDERAVNDEVLRLLGRAFPLDPSLPYPWREWRELTTWRGSADAMTRQVEARAARTGAGPLVGYRRRNVSIIHEGWELDVPGAFAERRTDEEWWGGDGGRSITLAATETGTDDGPMPALDFLRQVAPDLGSGALTHEMGEVIGRARLSTDPTSGVEVGVLEGYSAVRGRGAAIRITFDDSRDWQWALDMWRSLAPARVEAFARV